MEKLILGIVLGIILLAILVLIIVSFYEYFKDSGSAPDGKYYVPEPTVSEPKEEPKKDQVKFSEVRVSFEQQLHEDTEFLEETFVQVIDYAALGDTLIVHYMNEAHEKVQAGYWDVNVLEIRATEVFK